MDRLTCLFGDPTAVAHPLAVRRLCGAALGAEVAYFVTNLCRTDLLVEIEGIADKVKY